MNPWEAIAVFTVGSLFLIVVLATVAIRKGEPK